MSQQQGSPQQGAASPLLNLPGLGGGDPNDPALLGGPTTPWWRRPRTIVIAAIILLVILLLGILIPILNRPKPVNYQIQQPRTDTLAQTVTATGPLNSAIYNLNFISTGQGSGIIDELDVVVGQKVKKGQVLAKLNKTALQDAYNQAQTNVTNAQANVFQAENALVAAQNAANANNNAAQTQLNGSQNNQSAANNTSDATINADQTALDNAQTALDQARAVYNSTVAQANTQLQVDLRNCEKGTSGGATGSTGNFQNTFGSVGSLFSTFITTGKTPTVVATATSTSTSNKSGKNGSSTNNSSTNNNSSSSSSATPDPATVNACKNNAQAKHDSTIASAKASLNTAQANVDSAQSKLDSDRALANQTNTTNQSTVNNNKAGVTTSQASGNVSVQSAQTSLTNALNTLKTDQLLLEQAKHNLDNATLKAPHDGTVTTINGTVGSAPGTPPNASQQSTTTSTNTFIQLVDTGTLQVIANVNETDTANLKIGERAQFTVNSYGDRTFSGTISQISPNGQTVSNVVTYPVYIDVDSTSTKGANLFPGMTANVTITVLQRNNVLLIPVDAINFARLASGNGAAATAAGGTGVTQLVDRQSANSAMVQARQMRETLMAERDVSADNPNPAIVIVRTANGQFAAKPVVLGLTDGTNYEVLDGLTAQDNVVVGVAGNRTATGTSTSGGNGGGPGGG